MAVAVVLRTWLSSERREKGGVINVFVWFRI